MCSNQYSALNSALCYLACSVLLCTICIVFVWMIFLFNDHNNRCYSWSRYELGNKCVIATHFCCEIICCCCWITDWFTCEIVTLAGTEDETRSLQPTLFVILCVFEVVLLFWGCWMLCWWGEFVCFVLFLRCCLGFLRSSLWRTIYISTLIGSIHRSSVIFMDVPRAHESSHTEWST